MRACPGRTVAGPGQARPRWEYKALTYDQLARLGGKGDGDRAAAALNALGADGWELVGVVHLPPPPKPAPAFLPARPPGPGGFSLTMDPEMVWDQFYGGKGKDRIDLNDRPDLKARILERGGTVPADGVLTKDRFVAEFKKRMPDRAEGAGAARTDPVPPKPAPKEAPAPKRAAPADDWFSDGPAAPEPAGGVTYYLKRPLR